MQTLGLVLYLPDNACVGLGYSGDFLNLFENELLQGLQVSHFDQGNDVWQTPACLSGVNARDLA